MFRVERLADGRGVAVRWDGMGPAGSVALPCRGALSSAGVELVGPALSVAVPASAAGLRIREAAALICDKHTGKYAHASSFRDELLRSLKTAEECWGADTPWSKIERSHWTMLARRRLEQLLAKGCKATRAAEITVSRIITVVRWLRDENHIGRTDAEWPSSWKADVTKHWCGETGSARAPLPERPRYTLDELQAILAKTDFDPRFFLCIHLAIGLRPGQVARVLRSDLELPPVDWDAPNEASDYGVMHVAGAGKKGGVTTDLTRSQRRAIDDALTADGYLATVEAERLSGARKDYPLFPSGYARGRVGFLRGKDRKIGLGAKVDWSRSCSGAWLRKSWRVAEARAGIPHILGRATYGQRRLTVDIAKAMGLSPSAIQDVGGWTNSKMPLEVYAEGQNKVGRREARPVRAHILGEVGA